MVDEIARQVSSSQFIDPVPFGGTSMQIFKYALQTEGQRKRISIRHTIFSQNMEAKHLSRTLHSGKS